MSSSPKFGLKKKKKKVEKGSAYFSMFAGLWSAQLK